ncbi:hypothetical protein DBR09_05995 [Aeromonas sp. HMWF016]|nr:hypothetical protein DBR09_05995 [Aeromonas sp. HMWF016]
MYFPPYKASKAILMINNLIQGIWDTHLSEQGVILLKPTLPPVDYSFQYVLLTRAGSNPSQFNRF